MKRRERTLLTGMFAVRNFVATRINAFERGTDASALGALRTAQAYVHRFVDRAPGENESLMIAIVDVGLQLDAVIATLAEAPLTADTVPTLAWLAQMNAQIADLTTSLEQFDIIAKTHLSFVDESDFEIRSYVQKASSASL